MKRLRAVLFWCHLTAGISADLVILIMSATGALLAFESQIVDALEHGVRYVRPGDPAKRVGANTILIAAATAKPNVPPTGLTFTNQPENSVAVAFGRKGIVYVNPYDGGLATSTGTT